MAGSGGAEPETWIEEGTLADAMSYANGLGSGTAYIQLLTNIDKNNHSIWPLNFYSHKTTILDLNSYNIDRGLTAEISNGKVIYVDGTLTIRDSSTNILANQGKITGGYSNSAGGGGIYVSYPNGNFTLEGGSITNNEAVLGGGGVAVRDGSFTMLGGNITGNKTSDVTANQGGVYLGASITVGGTAVIKDNTNTSGSTTVERNVWSNKSGKIISVSTATPLTTGASIGVTTNPAPTSGNPINVTGDNSADYSSYFFSDNSDYAIQNSGSDTTQRVQLALNELTPPTVTPKAGITVTAQGWQNCVDSGSWGNWSVGVLPLDTSATYKLRYYATYSGGSVTLTATLTGFFTGPGVSGQAITFKNGATTLGTANLNTGGVATYTWTPDHVGTYSLTAEYAATGYNTAAVSSAVNCTVIVDPDIAIVAAAKTALVDRTVNVAFGADQTAKTAAVQAYVNGLLTGDATGVTATVTYNSGTGEYDVALSKGSVNDSKSLTMTVNIAPDPDIAIVAAAKTAVQDAGYGDMTQATATDETVIEAALKAAAETTVNDGTVTVTVDKVSYTEPVAGTSANPSGTDGSYVFTVTVSKGSQTQTTTQKTITITATPYQVIPTYEVSGTVNDESGSNISGASVTLMKGNTQIGTQGVTTDSNGEFTISDVPNGAYNLVIVHTDGTTVTIKVEITGADYAFTSAIILPPGKTNSIVEVKASTPDIIVGNLDTQFDSADIAYAQDPNNTVEIKLTAEKKDAETVRMDAIEIASVANNKTVEFYLDLSVTKTLTVSDDVYSTTPMSTLPSTIEIIIPLPQELQNKDGLVVYRVHNGTAAALPDGSANAVDGEYFTASGDMVTIYTKNFSTYAIGYTTPPIPPAPPKPHTNKNGGGSGRSSGSSAVSATINAEQSGGGKITVDNEKKTATVIPDDGYVIADIIVDGKSSGAVEKYTFTDSNTHKINAVFVKESALPYYLQDGEKVYIGFSGIAGDFYRYIAPTGVNVEFGENPKIFTDNTIAWAKPSIDFVTEREIFLGETQDKFSPNESMTRAMFVTVIGRLYERSYGSVSGASTFSDVDANAYYAKYVAWANENGIIKGIGENKFAPNERVTREQMAVIILNFATHLEMTGVTGGSLAYEDSASISAWAVDGAKYCQKTKVITGRNGGSFVPQESATRAEVAVVIERLIKTILK